MLACRKCKQCESLRLENETLRHKLAKARDALIFYADENNWESNRFTDEWGPAFDDGESARAALKELS